MVRYAQCCQPVPGDSIIGYITQGYGVTIHRTSCVNALRSSPDRQIEVEWNTESSESYPAKIETGVGPVTVFDPGFALHWRVAD